ncbi:MAG TPA: bi-domain-containing oxidoreductase [Pyrinomonadaceae bacterium]|jgi:predicted dehydrogenase/threonine dehydrogenase-like Zn-dependent dehydrogenase|nr:bi-domain-containing oxidoreductase [Pyrinomonadaceae bacterium]
MRQVVQNVKNGQLEVREVPPPALLPGGALVRTAASIISPGTEKSVLELGMKSLIGKARERPDLVREVVSRARTFGITATVQSVLSKMDQALQLGYSAAGVVEEVAAGVSGLRIGDRVAIAGAGYASHAEINFVPRNLTALIPENISFEEAAYTTVAAIAMQGVRLAKPELGEVACVNGLGLIGLITAQLLKANGCRVIGFDINKDKVELGKRLGLDEGVVLGSDEPHRAIDGFSNGRGVDLTLICAATSSNEPIELAGEITRKKGRIVAVGAVGLNVPRDIYYRKELELKISMSYGPGRYDRSYEEGGLDYPYDYVRWTERRNLKSVLDLMARGKLDVKSLTTHRFSVEKAQEAYAMIYAGREAYVGVLLEYDLKRQHGAVVRTVKASAHESRERLGIGFIGAGNYSSVHLLPHLKNNKYVRLIGAASATGLNAKQKADRFGFDYCATGISPLLEDQSIDAVFIGTRHSTHADFTVQALNAGKHVFVEKPMVVNEEQLAAVNEAYELANANKPTGLMVGLNRRFAPLTAKIKEALDHAQPLQMIYRVNSGNIPTSTWLHEEEQGGGMLVGEMCHFVDLMQFICGQRPASVYAQSLRANSNKISDEDNLSIVISFADGSVGVLCYNTVGSGGFSKERLEVFGGGVVAVLDDFRSLEIVKGGKPARVKVANQDKGQAREVAETVKAFRLTGVAPIPFSELVMGMRVVFAVRESLRSAQLVTLNN